MPRVIRRIEAVRASLAARRQRMREQRVARRNRAEATYCFYCGVAFEDGGSLARTVDHRLPRAGGGSDGLVNLVFACRACNQRKADTLEDEFVASDWLRQRRRRDT